MGRQLAELRDEGRPIIGSGFTTHNLRWFDPRAGSDAPPPQASAEFDHVILAVRLGVGRAPLRCAG